MAGLRTPLSTLHVRPHDRPRMTRGRCGSLLLHRNGLAPSALCRSPGAPDSGRSRDHKESRGPTLERGRTERSHDQMVAGLGPIYLPKRLQPTSVGRLRRSATRPRAPRSKAIAAIPDEASISGAEIVPWLPPLPLPLLPLPLPLPADACVTAPRARAEAI